MNTGMSSKAGGRRSGVSLVLASAIWFLALAPRSHAQKIVLQIRAGNPTNRVQTVQIRSSLPPRVGPNDVLSLGDLDLGYDVKTRQYYVHKSLDLAPMETRLFEVEIRDIWRIPTEALDALRQHAANVTTRLEGKPEAAAVRAIEEEVRRNLDLILASQEANAIAAGVKPIQHIRAHEGNLDLMATVKRALARMEDIALSAGVDPGVLMGEDKSAPRPDRAALSPAAYTTAVYRVTVRSTHPTETKKVAVRRELPSEIEAQDVLDTGGLELGVDTEQRLCYVYKDDVEIGPGETLTFDVKVRDKWRVNAPRIRALTEKATNYLSRLASVELYESLAKGLEGVIASLEALEAEQGPETLSDQYVAFYRDQADRVDAVERRLNRIESVLMPAVTRTQRGLLTPKPPSEKTTWRIIYIILVFLAAVSLLFFLRWYGRSKPERMADTPGR